MTSRQLESLPMRPYHNLRKPGAGLPLFRAYLSADGRQLTFMWHHVISDFEGMFNKHAHHLFRLDVGRTRFGYQIAETGNPQGKPATASSRNRDYKQIFIDRPLGFEETGFDVSKFVLPVSDAVLYDRDRAVGLPMSDIFRLSQCGCCRATMIPKATGTRAACVR